MRLQRLPADGGIGFTSSVMGMALVALLGGCVSTVDTHNPTPPSAKAAPLYTRMTEEDIELANSAVARALELGLSGTTFSWSSPDNDHRGTVTPTSSFRAKAGYFCRTYSESVSIGPDTESYTDTACRTEDGQWRPVAKSR